MKMQGWVRKYEAKAEPFILEDGFQVFFDEGKGFLCWKVEWDVLYIDHTSTNDQAWMHEKIRDIGREHGCRMAMTYTFRNPKAYVRLTGAHLSLKDSKHMKNGKFYWAFTEDLG